MASQVSHIVYAQKYFDKFPSTIDKEQFWLGCVFPDIRRVDPNVKRKDSHLILEDLNLDFSYLDSFHAGWKFHLYCDMKREEILSRYGFYNLKNAAEFCGQPAKMLEDELVYGLFNNWEKLVNYFNDPPLVETGLNVSRETFDFWYAITANYLRRKPDSRSVEIFLSKHSGLVSKAKDIVAMMDKLRKNDKVVEMLKKVAEEIV